MPPRGADAPLVSTPYPAHAGASFCHSAKRLCPLCASPKSPGFAHGPALSRRARSRTGLFFSSRLHGARSKVRRWAAPHHGSACWPQSSPSASGWAALGGHAGLNGPRAERRASPRPPCQPGPLLAAICRLFSTPVRRAPVRRARLPLLSILRASRRVHASLLPSHQEASIGHVFEVLPKFNHIRHSPEARQF